MKILFLGDVVGRSGRRAVIDEISTIKADYSIDFLIVNGENATGGMGISAAHAKSILEAGVDCITLGYHAFDQRDMLQFCESEPRIIRPMNIARKSPGTGAKLFTAQNGKKIFVAQALGQVFMKQPYDDPFSALDAALKSAPLGGVAQAVIVDFHAEATSEKMAMGHWLDGRASLVVGTHTHVPTADTMILPNGTGYQTDAGMCGDYNSVIGMDKEEPMRRFIVGMGKNRFTPASGEASLSGVLVTTDDKTGKALDIAAFRQKGRLSASPQ